uniref:Betasecretase putative n=1 Tax=Albugo laibachii Nc14 TaxID=890382 RepID=F0VZX4_9STRA|nr:betasecretase putative [Albugo laibachii Nc14]|eukprot:CCA14345.1 betasecretase putative [Albugo laibachii Nc14]
MHGICVSIVILYTMHLCISQPSTDIAMATIQQSLYGLPSGLAYYIEIFIGNPMFSESAPPSSKNEFNLLVDTGSSNTAAVSSTCCAGLTDITYDCSVSPTCQATSKTLSVSYITGTWSGKVVKDTFSGRGLGRIDNFPFAEILQQSNFVQAGYDGIVGLAYPSIAAPTDDAPEPYFETIKKARNTPNIFSLLMCGALQPLYDSYKRTSINLHAGEVLLGGITSPNGTKYHTGEIMYTPLIQERWYNVIVLDIGVDNTSLGIDCAQINNPRVRCVIPIARKSSHIVKCVVYRRQRFE